MQQPLRGCYRIALLSLKGGVGKTTITATLGATFASIRGDRVIAVDANPDRGTLSQKVPLETPATVRHLLRDAEGIEAYSDVRGYTSQGRAGWRCWPPKATRRCRRRSAPTTTPARWRCSSGSTAWCSPTAAPGMLHSAMSAVLDKADVLVVISSGRSTGPAARRRRWTGSTRTATRTWCATRSRSSTRCGRGRARSTCSKVVDHFSRRCRAVRQVPFDPHLEEGAEISLDRLKPETREALIELAAVVADGFPGANRPGASRLARRYWARVVVPRLSRRRKSGSSSGPITRVFGRHSRSSASAASRRRPGRPRRDQEQIRHEKTSLSEYTRHR